MGGTIKPSRTQSTYFYSSFDRSKFPVVAPLTTPTSMLAIRVIAHLPRIAYRIPYPRRVPRAPSVAPVSSISVRVDAHVYDVVLLVTRGGCRFFEDSAFRAYAGSREISREN